MMVNTLIIGCGPAGIAPLISASRSGALERILADGVAIADRGEVLGPGRIGGYAINSDSTGNTLVSCVVGNPHPTLRALETHPVVEAVAAYGACAVPLTLVAKFMELIGAALRDRVVQTGNTVLLGHEAIHTTQTGDGLWRTKLRRQSDGSERLIHSRFVVLATGGHQPLSMLRDRCVGGIPLLPRCAAKLVQSDEALTPAGLEAIGRRLSRSRSRRIAVIGSSSSALACANAILQTPHGRTLGEGALALLHRRPLHIFYPSAAEALADGYDEFTKDDICPISGFVFRLSGLRLEARELVMAARGIGGRAPEKRLRLLQVGAEYDQAALEMLDAAEVVISALGYRARALPILSAGGQPLPLFADGSANPLVDSECRILDRAGKPIDGLLGIGLGTGFFSRDLVGGELSFTGQTNSLWQWQNAVGGLIARAIQQVEPARRIPSGVLSALSPLQSA